MKRRDFARTREDGVALLFTLFLMAALSSMAVSLMFLAQTETSASRNYRAMSQARYAGEAGVHKVINYLLNTYTPPASSGSDLLTNYTSGACPDSTLPGCVLYGGQPVVLSSTVASSNYADSTKKTAFASAASGTLAIGTATATYNSYATLISMRQVSSYGTSITTVIQTWEITATGTVPGALPATVTVKGVIERQLIPSQLYAAFATGGTCGALSFSGGAAVNSYDSQALSGGVPVISSSDGNIGTNGNLAVSGSTSTVVNGSLSTPRTGVGSCSSGNVTAETISGAATITGGMIPLSQTVSMPPPDAPSPMPPTTTTTINSGACPAGVVGCTVASPGVRFAPGTYGNVSVSGGSMLHLAAGTYTLNSIVLSGGSSLVIDSGPVIVKVAGQSVSSPINLSGGAVTNSTYDPSVLQLLYGGSGSIILSGGTASSFMVYAPDAPLSFSGGSDFYGSVLAKTITDTGGTAIHYDRHLSKKFFTVGNPLLSSFSWKKY